MENKGPNIPLTRAKPSTFDESSLETFEGNLEQKINSLVLWINERVKRKQWSNEEIAEKFVKRNAEQILADGDTGFMNPCSDLTLVALALLKKNGFKSTLVVEKLKQKKYDFVGMHFVLEFLEKDVLYFLEFVEKNHVLLKKGGYTHQKEGIETLRIQRITNDVRLDQNIQSILEEAQFDISDFRLEDLIAQLQKDNSPQTYTGYVSKLAHDGNLYLDSQIT
ncbi:hypothetical protein A2738_03670 [Candidatus Nomurabacteria bacterium RIFCSPHIGHO2_01_FULL_42_15]|uniref:Transglutaminase-like domain-containing protein n=1 Tax=Candidatus Nomurabacteria bacterium RIFCSPHIGHO2_01_FULL_42_15 TaxID=1801742 RepID=A0A1F6VEA9_9BACT|nr:MAG: hypothetical protein A2738_03670 [Candidatus Nomurabacteria bacterium RIFCSPHIGHO2_01_FULL_42_15]OGI93302.1 MAG: hypothetical protein A3A99_03525 [Candidatus Nomurabacteria bacterium RIFCSPLOWO2_01_FULL_41_18]